MTTQITCLMEACKRLSIPYTHTKSNRKLLTIHLDKPYFFFNNITPLNTEDIECICRKKIQTYLLLQDTIPLPLTTAYSSEMEIDAIVKEILAVHSFPVIIKRNSGMKGKNVFLCNDVDSINLALRNIFNKEGRYYDNTAIAQEYISIQKEYRVLCLNGKILFTYLKDISSAEFSGNLSPLHWTNAKAQSITDQAFIKKLHMYLQPVFSKLPLVFGGIDIAEDANGKLQLIEINTKPGLDIFLRDNDPEIAIEAYMKILLTLK